MGSTLLQLRTRARERSEMEASTYITDSEANSYVNAAYAELFDYMVDKAVDFFVRAPTSFTLTNATNIFDLTTLTPAWYKIRGLDFQIGEDFQSVRRLEFPQRNIFNNAGIRWGYRWRAYDIKGESLYLYPENSAAGVYRIWYVPQRTALAIDTDEIDDAIPQDWEEYVVIATVIKMLTKEESDTAPLERELARMRDRIERLGTSRDQGEPSQVLDVQDVGGPWLG